MSKYKDIWGNVGHNDRGMSEEGIFSQNQI